MNATTKPSAKDEKIAALERKLKEAEAYQIHRLAFASTSLNKVSTDKLMASGIMLELTFLGGKEAIYPVIISDGLSNETIACLKADILRAYNRMTEIKP